jgi:hypothetical protein
MDFGKFDSVKRMNEKTKERKDICSSALSKISRKPDSAFSTNSNILRPYESSRHKTGSKFLVKRSGNSNSKSKSKSNNKRTCSSYQNTPNTVQRLKKARSTDNFGG